MTLIEATRTTMTSYLETLIAQGNFGQYLTSDVSLQLMWSDQEAHGRDAVEGMIHYLHDQAFDAQPELKCLLVDGERAVVEVDFVARHIAEFAGRPATGKDVRVPYTVMYDVESDRIKALRMYFSLDELLRQIDAKE
jgi:predicted ester cyclase